MMRLETAYEQLHARSQDNRDIAEMAVQVLTLEFQVPHALKKWEAEQLGRTNVPDELQSAYYTWNTARYARIDRLLSEVENLQERSMEKSEVARFANDLEAILADLELRTLERLRPDIRVVLE